MPGGSPPENEKAAGGLLAPRESVKAGPLAKGGHAPLWKPRGYLRRKDGIRDSLTLIFVL